MACNILVRVTTADRVSKQQSCLKACDPCPSQLFPVVASSLRLCLLLFSVVSRFPNASSLGFHRLSPPRRWKSTKTELRTAFSRSRFMPGQNAQACAAAEGGLTQTLLRGRKRNLCVIIRAGQRMRLNSIGRRHETANWPARRSRRRRPAPQRPDDRRARQAALVALVPGKTRTLVLQVRGAAEAEWAKTGISERGPWAICVGCASKRG